MKNKRGAFSDLKKHKYLVIEKILPYVFMMFIVVNQKCTVLGQSFSKNSIDINNLAVHDPDIYADTVNHTYYLYGNYSPKRSFERIKSSNGNAGVQVYWSKDLQHWYGPKMVFEIPDNFWASKKDAPWAPEVHYYKGKYYMFVTFNNWNKIIGKIPGRPALTERGSQILISDSPTGPFKPFYNHPTLPDTMMTLDATFWVQNGQPWIVFSHEWVQVTVGSIEAFKLSKNLSHTIGRPIKLFSAGDVRWTKREFKYKGKLYPGIVTDGPYLYRTKGGSLIMIWSSWSKRHSYALALAWSASGKLKGPWKHLGKPILENDQGHGMIFRDFKGRLLLVCHKYFHMPKTRVEIYELKDTGHIIKIVRKLYGAK